MWRADGKELFFREGTRMMSVDVDAGSDCHSTKPRLLFDGVYDEGFDVTRDGQRFLMVRRNAPLPRTQINVVMGALQ